MDIQQNNAPTDKNAALANKYITFKLGDEEYGFEILRVREIIGLMEITRVPQANSAVKGVINLRGKVNPVLDLRLVFGMTEIVPTDQTVIVIVQLEINNQQNNMGVLVDRVLEVLNVDSADIEPPPDMGDFQNNCHDHLMGVAKVGKRVVFLLDIAKVLAARSEAIES